MQTLDKIISDKVRTGVEDAVAAIETRVLDVILSEMDSVVVPGMELAMRDGINWFFFDT